MKSNPFAPRYYSEGDLANAGFAKMGRSVQIHEHVNIYGVENIHLGDHVRIDSFVTIIASGPVHIGSYIHIGSYCLLSGGEGITMEDFSGLSQGVKLYTRSDDYSGEAMTNPMVPSQYTKVKRGAIRLGRHVIIGAGSIVLPGVAIEEGSAVGALSLVTKNLAAWGMYAGVPARRLRARSKNLLTLEAAFWADQK